MINDLDETIKQLLIKKGNLNPAEVDISFDMPDREWSAAISKPTVNIYLYDVHENLDMRDNMWDVIKKDGRVTRAKRPIRMDLSYLITVWTNDTADQHQLLSYVLQVLYRHPEIPSELLSGRLTDVTVPIRTWTAQPDGVLRNSADFWSALDNNLKPSISYVVTVPVDVDVSFEAPETSTRIMKFLGDGGQAEEQLLISGVIHRKGNPDDVIPDASVLARELQQTTKSNEQGVYAFRKMKLGTHEFEVTLPGEKPKKVAVTVPSLRYDIEI